MNIYAGLDPDQAQHAERLSRLMHELRENRKLLLAPYGIDDEAQLLDRIRAGTVPEHPAYEAYLGARLLRKSHDAVRAELSEFLQGMNGHGPALGA